MTSSLKDPSAGLGYLSVSTKGKPNLIANACSICKSVTLDGIVVGLMSLVQILSARSSGKSRKAAPKDVFNAASRRTLPPSVIPLCRQTYGRPSDNGEDIGGRSADVHAYDIQPSGTARWCMILPTAIAVCITSASTHESNLSPREV